jgi:hypothetical protein
LAAIARTLRNLGAAAVAQCQVEQQTVIGGGGRQHLPDGGTHVGRQAVMLAENAQADVGPYQFRLFVDEKALQQTHERIDFAGGPLPVFRGKSIQGQHGDVEFTAGAHNGANRIGALFVSHDAVQEVFLGPAAISIHDNGHVAGQRRDTRTAGLRRFRTQEFLSLWFCRSRLPARCIRR